MTGNRGVPVAVRDVRDKNKSTEDQNTKDQSIKNQNFKDQEGVRSRAGPK